VSVSGDVALVGAYADDDNGTRSGAAYVFNFLISEIQISIDIKPGACPNNYPIKGGGSVKVAILGTVDFDVNDIDIASIRLEGVAPTQSRFKDKCTLVSDPADECDCTIERRDGFLDLCLKFKKKEILSVLGEVNFGDSFVLTLTGSLNNGTLIEGQDCIVFIKKGKKD